MRPRSRFKFFCLLLAALVASPLALSGSVFASTPLATAPLATAPLATAPLATAPLATAPLAGSPSNGSPLDDALLYQGFGFDTCYVPSLEKMRAWRRSSPYEAIGVYIGGISAFCRTYSDQYLTREWVETAHAMGWRLIPTYVGVQAACTTKSDGKPYTYTISAKNAKAQAKNAASDAIAQMKKRGLGKGNPIYYDMEGWNHKNAKCTAPVVQFMDTWTVELHKAGYISGFYSSAGAGMPAIVTAEKTDPLFHAPDAIWIAHHDNVANTTSKYVDDDVWTNHQRIKQYRGGHGETHGGEFINIDSNYVDGPVTGTVIEMKPASIPVVAAATSTSVALKGQGGEGPYSYSVTAGELPPGLKLSKGKITGKPTKPGAESAVTVRVTDSGQPTRSGSRNYLIYTTYSDVPADQLFFNPIKWLVTNAITFGYHDGSFRPNGSVTRGQMAAFLFRARYPHTKAPACDAKQFKDVTADSLFCGHITWMASTGITFGYPDGTFRDSVPVTREQMAAFLYRYLYPRTKAPACDAKQFSDVNAGNKFCGHITWLAKSGITVGYSDGTFRPNNEVTRGSMAAFLQRVDRRR